MGHARALLGLSEAADLQRAAEKVIREKLSVRAAEQLVHRLKSWHGGREKDRVGEGATHLRHVVEKLQRRLGTKVDLKNRGKTGTLEIRYGSPEDLDRILGLILGE
jgi:ParB family chromosome partitioning protein